MGDAPPPAVAGVRSEGVRDEHDLIGEGAIPAAAYYGAHTARAVDHLPISGITLASQPHFVAALATVG